MPPPCQTCRTGATMPPRWRTPTSSVGIVERRPAAPRPDTTRRGASSRSTGPVKQRLTEADRGDNVTHFGTRRHIAKLHGGPDLNGDRPVSTTTATRTYKIDKSHSEAVFQVRHLVTKVRGRFTDFEGAIEYNEAAPEQSTVNFTITTASVDTAEADRDKHLRSADFFDVENHPDMTFRSKRITKRGAETFDVVGDLTIRGVTKEVVLPVAHMGK